MYFIELLKAVLFGIVEGITEWLPISSTGHLILLNEFLSLDTSPEFWEMFEVVIQLGAILAVIVLFFDRLNPFSARKTASEKRGTWSLWFKVCVAVVPSAVVGLLFDDWFNARFYNYAVVSTALIVYGAAFIAIERTRAWVLPKTADTDAISYKTAFLIGIFQVLSLIPGTSRSGSTILGAMLIGLSRTAAAEFSFFMAIPTMAGASFLKLVKFFADSGTMTSHELFLLLTGSVSAFLVSLAAIKYLMEYVRRHSFSVFGIYRIVLGALVLAYFIIVK